MSQDVGIMYHSIMRGALDMGIVVQNAGGGPVKPVNIASIIIVGINAQRIFERHCFIKDGM